MIVVEGLDNTGKSTLVQKIHRDFPGFKAIPSIGNKHDIQQIRMQAFDGLAVDVVDPYTLWDRSRFISEYVYTPIVKNRPIAFDLPTWLDLMYQYTQTTPQLFILCTRPLDRILSDFDSTEQLPGVKQRLAQLEQSYARVCSMLAFLFGLSRHNSRIVKYDFEEHDYKRVVNAVTYYMKEVEEY